MPGCHAEQLEFLVYGLRFSCFYLRKYIFLTSAMEIRVCQNPGAMHESMISNVYIEKMSSSPPPLHNNGVTTLYDSCNKGDDQTEQ